MAETHDATLQQKLTADLFQLVLLIVNCLCICLDGEKWTSRGYFLTCQLNPRTVC
jgi:hypothetical protein